MSLSVFDPRDLLTFPVIIITASTIKKTQSRIIIIITNLTKNIVELPSQSFPQLLLLYLLVCRRLPSTMIPC